jgi:predicted nucleic acid-binding protein
MPFVLDASVAVAWTFDDQPPSALQARARIRTDKALVPGLWWFEVRNALIVNERSGRLTAIETEGSLHDLSCLHIAVDHAPDESSLLALTRRHRLTVYDAAYLELAQREKIPLATLDAALARAARAEKVALL